MFQTGDPLSSSRVENIASNTLKDNGKASEESAPFLNYLKRPAETSEPHDQTDETLTGPEQIDPNTLGDTVSEVMELVDLTTLKPRPLVQTDQPRSTSETFQIVDDSFAIPDSANAVSTGYPGQTRRLDEVQRTALTDQTDSTTQRADTISLAEGDGEAVIVEDGMAFDKKKLFFIQNGPDMDGRTGNSSFLSRPVEASSISVHEATGEFETHTGVRSSETSLLKGRINSLAGAIPLATFDESAFIETVTAPVTSGISDTQSGLLPLSAHTPNGQSGLTTGPIGTAAAGSLTAVQTISLNNPDDLIGIVRDTPVGSGNEERIVVQLDPPELGRISIDFKFDGQSLQHVTITGENPEAMKKLRLMHFELFQALSDRGLPIDSLTFNQNMPGDTQRGPFAPTTVFGENTNATEDDIAPVPINVGGGPVANQLLSPNNGLDIRV